MLRCNQCGLEKQLTEFYKDKASLGGIRKNCKSCKNKKTLFWREANREHYNEIARKHNRANYEQDRLRRYKLTVEKHTQMLIKQNYVCALCGKPPTDKRALATDHDHVTGEVRGLLCYKCNRDMATVDDKDFLSKLIAYRDKKHG